MEGDSWGTLLLISRSRRRPGGIRRDVAVRWGSEQEDRLGDVFRSREAPGRSSLSHGLAHLVAEAGEVVLGDGEAGADDVDEDPGRACLPLEGGEEPIEGALRRRVGGRARPAVTCDTGGDQDDPSCG